MKTMNGTTENNSDKSQNGQTTNAEPTVRYSKNGISRRSFLGKSLAVGAGTIGAGLLPGIRTATASGGLTSGDAALLRFAAAAEILETDFWVQYNELGRNPRQRSPGRNWQSNLHRGPESP